MDFPFRTLRRQFRPARSGIDKCWHPYRSTHPGHCWHRFTARAIGDGDKRVYRYSPFHRFEISFTRAAVEPLIFIENPTGAGTSLLINLDLWLFLKLKGKHQEYGGIRPRESRLCASTLLRRVNWKSLKSWLSTFANTFRRARWCCLSDTYAVFR